MPSKPLVFKTQTTGWVYDGDLDTVTQITDADYPAATVPGIVYLDGTYYVMTGGGVIYGSNVDAPLVWTALNFISAETETDTGQAIAKYLNYLVAFGQWTTEFFYDAAVAAPASPLLRAENLFLQIGCANPYSIAKSDNALIWMAQTKEGSLGFSAGRTIVMLTGTQITTISTEYVDRLITADTLSEVFCTMFKHNGHSFYMLTLTNTAITLVYDLTTKLWSLWTSMTVQSPKSVTSLTYDASTGLATATSTAHGYADGDEVTMAGAAQTEYNVTANITYLTADTYTYPVSGAPVSPATGTITATGYTESYFKLVYHTVTATENLFADVSSGRMYALSASSTDDNGSYINMFARTGPIDNHTNEYKQFERLELIGDKVTGNALIRYSKDDYQTFSKYRKVNLLLDSPQLVRMGRARRASFDIRVTDSVAVRLERLDITL